VADEGLSILGEDGYRVDESQVDENNANPLLKILLPESSDSFWEYELVVLEGEDGQWTELNVPGEIVDVRTDTTRNIQNTEVKRGFVTKDPKLEYSPGKTTDFYLWSQTSKPDASSGQNLEVDIIITLKEEANMNELTISPHTFGKRAYPLLKEVSTANADSQVYVPLPQFSQLNQGILSKNSVDSRPKNTITLTSPAHFTFPNRAVKSIKISLAQDTAYQIGYTMALASKNWTLKELDVSGREISTFNYTEYFWVDILGKAFSQTLADIIRSELSLLPSGPIFTENARQVLGQFGSPEGSNIDPTIFLPDLSRTGVDINLTGGPGG
jgi:hypothetical protein